MSNYRLRKPNKAGQCAIKCIDYDYTCKGCYDDKKITPCLVLKGLICPNFKGKLV